MPPVCCRLVRHVRDDADLDALETAITAAITALIAASNAQTATRLATKRTIGGVAFDGSANIHHYATCSTAAATAAKTVALSGFALATGARVLVKFTVTNSAANPTLDVNGTGAKPIQYRGAAIAAGTLAANRTYEFVYTGAQYELVGDVDTNTTYSLATASNDGLMAKGDKGKLDGIAVGAEGWISGMSNAFPREGETLFRLAAQKRYDEAMALYRWFMPLLHLDARPDLVQCIKLCEELLGRGSAITRPPRLALEGETRQQVVNIVEQALATRPVLPDVGL